ncbi:MAG: uroporphyrinogen-III C-methyltransferase [Chromatocurvus sp.]
MADEDNKPAVASEGARPAPEPAAARSTFPPVHPASDTPAARSGSAAIAWLALLLVLLLAAVGVWTLLEAQQRESDLRQRLQAIEVGSGRDVSAIEQVSANLQRQVELEVAAAQTLLRGEWRDQVAQLRERARQIASQSDEISGLQQDFNRRVASVEEALVGARQLLEHKLADFEGQLERQRAQLDRFSADDRESWLLAEAHYLLRLANQRLTVKADTEVAEALLVSADTILRELDDAGLLEVRRALAADIAAVRAVPRLDLEGVYARLGALVERSDSLLMPALPERHQEPAAVETDNWRARFHTAYDNALEKLSSYVVFRRRDVPVEALMDPQLEGMGRQNLRMLLEQARIAVLSGNQRVFRESLQRARSWISQFFDSEGQAARAMMRELGDLEATPVSVEIPDASQTLQAMQAVMADRTRDRGTAP